MTSESSDNDPDSPESRVRTHSCSRTTVATRSRNTPLRVVDYDTTSSHLALVNRMLAQELARHHNIGDGSDPFSVLPQFQNEELNASHLLRNGKT